MSTKAEKRQKNNIIAVSASGGNDSFNFELWASEVRRQMLASLQKKAQTNKI
ncbi:MAG: hypothetical protein AB1589_06690 [Cyanobacteriota bacterium]